MNSIKKTLNGSLTLIIDSLIEREVLSEGLALEMSNVLTWSTIWRPDSIALSMATRFFSILTRQKLAPIKIMFLTLCKNRLKTEHFFTSFRRKFHQLKNSTNFVESKCKTMDFPRPTRVTRLAATEIASQSYCWARGSDGHELFRKKKTFPATSPQPYTLGIYMKLSNLCVT